MVKISFMLFLAFIMTGASLKSDRPFTIILLPDTQCYVDPDDNFAGSPEIFYSQTRWIARVKDSLNVAFVLQLGDVTNRNLPEQWLRADTAMRFLDGKVPYLLNAGNHDNGDSGRSKSRDPLLFNKTFPVSRYSKAPWWGGTFEPGHLENSYAFFTADGRKYIAMALEFGPRDTVLTWAGKIIEAHPDCQVIISTHSYLYSDNTLLGKAASWNPHKYGMASGPGAVNDGEEMWDKLIRKHKNILMVVNGHVLNEGAGRLVSRGDSGNYVYQMLSNYQGDVIGTTKGGNGFLRILTFYPDGKRISVRTYSPYAGRFDAGERQSFDINLEKHAFSAPAAQ